MNSHRTATRSIVGFGVLVYLTVWGGANAVAAQLLIGNNGGGDILYSTGGTSTTFITTPAGYSATDIKEAANGNYYVLANLGVLEYTHAGVQIGSTPFSNGDGASPLNNPQELVIQPNGSLLVSSYGTNVVNRYSGTTGTYIDSPVSANGPTGMAFHNGNLYVAALNSNVVAEFQPQPDGTPYTSLGTFATAAGAPHHVAFGPDGNLYVTEFSANLVEKFNGTTGADMGAFVTAGSGGLANPTGLAFGPGGELYVSSYSGGQVLEYNPNGSFNSVFLSGLTNPIGLFVVPEPSTISLALMSAVGLVLVARRRRR